MADVESCGLSIFLKYMSCSKNCKRAGSESGPSGSTEGRPPPEPEEEEAETDDEDAVELLLLLILLLESPPLLCPLRSELLLSGATPILGLLAATESSDNSPPDIGVMFRLVVEADD